jgi:hypothetical protein
LIANALTGELDRFALSVGEGLKVDLSNVDTLFQLARRRGKSVG